MDAPGLKKAGPGVARSILARFLITAVVPVCFVIYADPASCARILEISPYYSIYVRLHVQSPFIPDGRSSFADFDMDAAILKVQLTYTNDLNAQPGAGYTITQPGFLSGWQVGGEGNLSSYRLNLVDDGSGPKPARITEGPKPFEVTLSLAGAVLGPNASIPPEPLVPPEDPLDRGSQVPLLFSTSFGLDTLRWEYPGGSSYLENERTIVLIPWRRLMQGKDFTVEIPYEGCFEEDSGTWEFRFIPE